MIILLKIHKSIFFFYSFIKSDHRFIICLNISNWVIHNTIKEHIENEVFSCLNNKLRDLLWKEKLKS